MSLEPRAVIFDYAEVLSRPPPDADWRALVELSGLSWSRLNGLYWRRREPYDRGAVDGPTYWRELAEEAEIRLSGAQLEALIEADCRSWLHPNPLMVGWLERLQARGMTTAILSNIGLEMSRRVEELPWIDRCEHRTFSCEVASVKPEPQIYRCCLSALGLEAEQALFIDDRPVNIEAAARLGLNAILFDGAEGLMRRLEPFDLPEYPRPS